MLDFKKLPLDAQLAALLDGETTPEQKQELEQRLATDEGAKRLYDKLRHGADFGKHRLDDVLREPVPLALVRSIKSAQPPKAPVAPRVSRPSFKLAPIGPQALAAAIVLLIAGCGIGFFAAGSMSTMQSPAATTMEAIPDSNEWLTDVIANQRLIARQPRHIFEVPSTQAEEISTWLTSTVGVAFRVPDLSEQGWTFQGARVFIGDSRPVGQLVYTSSDGDLASICFRKDNLPSEADDFKETIKDEIGVVSWHNAGTSYVLVGPSSEASLGQLAMQVATSI
ncbi:Fis family transcriptional regulator [Rhizobium altiplani]|uniref:Fis family transcriptional regulator n=1 Tax=Rhizobium altiplani TaxID=1864509 RepID=A0A120FM73_9HYPH|nr:anti-sigma factor [Rhizobium altiplani]KWV53357.1 Fis family transcriptional regulator [Rhizobium altiplani]